MLIHNKSVAIIIIPIILKLCQHNWEKPNKDQRSHIVGTIGKKASEFVFIQITLSFRSGK